jgi:hypothetical protein
VLKLIRDSSKGRGTKAPASARPNLLLGSLGGDKPKTLFAGAGVIAAAVAVVSFLTWLAPNSDRPVPLQVVDRVLPGVAQQIEEQAATLLEGGKETVQETVRNVREGLAGAGSGITQIANASSRLVAPSPATPGTATSSPEGPPPSTGETSSAPGTAEPSPPPTTTTDAPPAVSSEPATSWPATEEPPPTTEEPPPTTEEPTPPPTEVPPPATSVPPPPPPTTSQPPSPIQNEPPSPPASNSD